MALVSKFSALLVVPIIGLIVVLVTSVRGSEPRLLPLKTNPNRRWQKYVDATVVLSVIFFVALLVIRPAYFFGGYEPWLSGLRHFLSIAQAGRLAFFLGEYSEEGWWSYYIVAFIIKTPIGSLLLIAGSLLFHRQGTPLRRDEAIFLLLPVVFIFLATTQAKMNIGVRHILMVYPFLFILAARLATIAFQRRWIGRVLIGAPVILTAVSALRIAPHQLAYFNELVGGPEQGYRYLSDSNLDWGQDLKGVQEYMAKEEVAHDLLLLFWDGPTRLLRYSLPIRAGGGFGLWSRLRLTRFRPQRRGKFSRSAFTTCKILRPSTTRSFVGSGTANPSRKSATRFLSTT